VTKPSIYLDYNATAPIRPEARDAVLRAFETAGNPSSVHASGRAARDLVETARAQVAALVGVVAGSVTFVSGGTEANALAIGSAAFAGFNRVIVSEGEHDAVLETAAASGLQVLKMPLDADGVARLDWLEEALSDEGRALVCLMLANNETGVIQKVAEASALVRAADGWLHVDAVQAAGKIAIDFSALGADTLALSAHKLGGPQGVGALVAGTRATIVRQQHGGGQERGRRAGTENVAGIAGFGAAAEAASRDLPAMANQGTWRDALAERVKAAPTNADYGLEINKTNQFVVNERLETSAPDVWALGDCAAAPWIGTEGKEGRIIPARAQAAHQQASYLAKALIARTGQRRAEAPFVYRDFGSLLSLGENKGVGALMGGLGGPNFFVEGLIAKWAYISLHLDHHRAIMGTPKTIVLALARLLQQRVAGRLKLH
jgi:cysteine desulfurase